jgi:hypothetical protein
MRTDWAARPVYNSHGCRHWCFAAALVTCPLRAPSPPGWHSHVAFADTVAALDLDERDVTGRCVLREAAQVQAAFIQSCTATADTLFAGAMRR